MENSCYGERIARLNVCMEKANIDAFFTLAAPSIRYLTGFTGEESYLLAVGGTLHLIVDGRFTTQAQEECPWLDTIQYSGTFMNAMHPLLSTAHAHWLGFEKDRISFVQAEDLRTAFPFVQPVATQGVVEGLRLVKDDGELAVMRAAGRVADKAFRAMAAQLKAGMSENDAAALLEYEMRKAGAQGTSFTTIVASGARGALPHGVASDKVIQQQDVIVIDFGVNYKGYMSDCTRTVALGEQPVDVRQIYGWLLEAQLLGLSHIKAGVSSRSVDTAVREKLAEHDLAKYFTHSLGHGVGLEIHELPRLSQGTDSILQAGEIVTCEPGVYLPGRFGMRVEDSVIVTENGVESLTELPKDLVLS